MALKHPIGTTIKHAWHNESTPTIIEKKPHTQATRKSQCLNTFVMKTPEMIRTTNHTLNTRSMAAYQHGAPAVLGHGPYDPVGRGPGRAGPRGGGRGGPGPVGWMMDGRRRRPLTWRAPRKEGSPSVLVRSPHPHGPYSLSHFGGWGLEFSILNAHALSAESYSFCTSLLRRLAWYVMCLSWHPLLAMMDDVESGVSSLLGSGG